MKVVSMNVSFNWELFWTHSNI